MSTGSIAATVGLLSSSYFFFSNVGCAFFGVMPAMARVSVPTHTKLALWADYYNVAKVHMAAAANVTALSLTIAAYFTPHATLRTILGTGASAAATVGIFTLFALMPVNNDLLARHAKQMEIDAAGEAHIEAQLNQWSALHRVRIVLGAISFLSATTALLASSPIIQL
ncbi:hypothetical protein FB45DRAFT_1026475 [Roridomyces roridus]|uniref:DUF1772-domain-containing protein n=1 Tax=Roridomyces roridus TaxID=1738132 RepID=A0AAD7BW97_9AGAR|nr:hypothetical protein FB45DRAFT_1026475 [Roridomyces roridus]